MSLTAIIFTVVVVCALIVVVLLCFAEIKLDGLTLVRLLNADTRNLSFDFETDSAKNGTLVTLLSGLAVVIRHGILFLTGGLLPLPSASSAAFAAAAAATNPVVVNDNKYHHVSLITSGSVARLIVDGKLQDTAVIPDSVSWPIVQDVYVGGVPCDEPQNIVGAVKNINVDRYEVVSAMNACPPRRR